jgi:hypothetical protein
MAWSGGLAGTKRTPEPFPRQQGGDPMKPILAAAAAAALALAAKIANGQPATGRSEGNDGPPAGAALAPGDVWPTAYRSVALPAFYVNFYHLGADNSYRHYGDAIYRVDPQTAAITRIAALLTGDKVVVGRPMPPGYDVYNLPESYRPRFTDSPGALYRYSDGYIYQLDPDSRIVRAAIALAS